MLYADTSMRWLYPNSSLWIIYIKLIVNRNERVSEVLLAERIKLASQYIWVAESIRRLEHRHHLIIKRKGCRKKRYYMLVGGKVNVKQAIPEDGDTVDFIWT